MQTQEFRTKSVFNEVKNPEPKSVWPVAIDVGYSSVKGYSPNSTFIFPSYARNLGKNPELLSKELGEETLIYRDGDSGEQWLVGADAQRGIDNMDTNDSQLELYGRDRYYSPMFKVLMRTAIALGMLSNEKGSYNGDKPLYIQTGLPPAYLDDDSETFKDTIEGRHVFAVKTAKTQRFIPIDITVARKNISIMSQPQGTLVGLSCYDDARSIVDSSKFVRSSVLMFDGGFGTLDVFDIKGGQIASKQTFTDLGMREVLQCLSDKIKHKYSITIMPSALQNTLESGTVKIKKRKGNEISSRTEDISALLEEASNEVCDRAIERILNSYAVENYRYFIVTGGTGSAWFEKIRKHFAEVDGLEVIKGNAYSPETDMVFCNVRGYYVGRVNNLIKTENKKAS